MEAWLFWVIIAVISFVFEALTVGLVSVWFGLSAIVTALFSAAAKNIFNSGILFVACQATLFIGFSVLFLYLTKPFVSRYIKPQATNAPAIIGKEALVLEDIDNLNGTGSIKIGGIIWSAKSENNQIIRKGEIVTVKEIAGVSAIVAVKVANEVF